MTSAVHQLLKPTFLLVGSETPTEPCAVRVFHSRDLIDLSVEAHTEYQDFCADDMIMASYATLHMIEVHLRMNKAGMVAAATFDEAIGAVADSWSRS